MHGLESNVSRERKGAKEDACSGEQAQRKAGSHTQNLWARTAQKEDEDRGPQ